MYSVPSNTTGSGLKINNMAEALMAKASSQQATSGSTSFNRDLIVQDKPLDLSIKRKPDEERSVSQYPREKRCKVATSENQVAGRQSPQPSGSGQASHPFEFYPLFEFYPQNQQQLQQLQQLQQSELVSPSKEVGMKKLLICDVSNCRKGFAKQSALVIHKRTHTGEKPYKCSFLKCEKQFTQKGHLNRHEKIHKGEKPFKCRSCVYVASRTDLVSSHFKIRHPEQSQDDRKWVNVPQPDSTSTTLTIPTARLWNRPQH